MDYLSPLIGCEVMLFEGEANECLGIIVGFDKDGDSKIFKIVSRKIVVLYDKNITFTNKGTSQLKEALNNYRKEYIKEVSRAELIDLEE